MATLQTLPVGRAIIRQVRREHGQRILSIPKTICTALGIEPGHAIAFQRFADGSIRLVNVTPAPERAPSDARPA